MCRFLTSLHSIVRLTCLAARVSEQLLLGTISYTVLLVLILRFMRILLDSVACSLCFCIYRLCLRFIHVLLIIFNCSIWISWFFRFLFELLVIFGKMFSKKDFFFVCFCTFEIARFDLILWIFVLVIFKSLDPYLVEVLFSVYDFSYFWWMDL